MQANMELRGTLDVVSTLGYYRSVADGMLMRDLSQKEEALLHRYRQMEYFRKQDLY